MIRIYLKREMEGAELITTGCWRELERVDHNNYYPKHDSVDSQCVSSA